MEQEKKRLALPLLQPLEHIIHVVCSNGLLYQAVYIYKTIYSIDPCTLDMVTITYFNNNRNNMNKRKIKATLRENQLGLTMLLITFIYFLIF